MTAKGRSWTQLSHGPKDPEIEAERAMLLAERARMDPPHERARRWEHAACVCWAAGGVYEELAIECEGRAERLATKECNR